MKRWHWFSAVPVLLVAVLVLIMHGTTPLQIGPAGILLVFLLLYATLLSICFLCIYAGSKLLIKLKLRKERQHIRPRKAYYIASVVAALPLFLVAIQTTRQLRLVDVLLVVVFVGLATFYVTRRT